VTDRPKATPTILRRPQVEARTGLSRSSLYEMIRRGTFPAPIRLGGARAVGWVEDEISSWCEQQIAASRHEKVGR